MSTLTTLIQYYNEGPSQYDKAILTLNICHKQKIHIVIPKANTHTHTHTHTHTQHAHEPHRQVKCIDKRMENSNRKPGEMAILISAKQTSRERISPEIKSNIL